MSLPAISDSEAFKEVEEVADLMMQGKSKYSIARTLGIKVVEADMRMNQWRQLVSDDLEARDAAKDHLNAMVVRYDRLIEQANENLENLKSMIFDEKISAQINTTLKNIAEFDAKRVDLLQKAGLLEGADLGDELAEREQREEFLLNILKNDLCGQCREVVKIKISRMTGKIEEESVVFDAEVVDDE